MQPRKQKIQLTFVVAMLAILVGAIIFASDSSQAAPMLQESDDAAQDNPIFIPFVAGGGAAAAAAPLTPEQYAAESEDAPSLADEDVQTSTWCSSYIKFRNNSSHKIKIYWVKNSYSEVLYKTLDSGKYYWQHTYYGHDWKVRDTSGNLLKSFSAKSCSYMYVTIDDDHFPHPTPTPTPKATTPPGGACYTKIIATHSNKCMDVWNYSTSSGAKIQQWSCSSSNDNQRFSFDLVPGTSDTYVIKAKHSGKVLDVKYGSTQAGKNLVQERADGSNSQKWKVISVGGDIYELKNVKSGLVADVEGASGSNGAYVIQWGDNNAANQRWKIEGCINPEPTPTSTAVPPTPTNTPAPQLGSIGDRVWNDFDRDGIQDGGEPGVPNVTVQLKDCSGNVLQSQPTDGNGIYTFGNLSAACYTIGVVVPNGFQLSPKAQGTNGDLDSDINIGNAMSDNINLGAGQNITNIDAGINQPVAPTPTNTPAPQLGSLGDRVWLDTNDNGIQDGGEAGVSGVSVVLRDCNNNTLDSTTTNIDGNYNFGALSAGCYVVRFTNINSDLYSFSQGDQGGDDALDSDVISLDTVTPGIVNGQTANINLGAGENNNTVDAGLVPQPVDNAAIGDKVFRDDNGNGQQDGGEPGVAGVSVQLKDCNDNQLDSTTTDINGIYGFSGLAAGCYTIGVALPDGYTFSPQNVGNDNTDSDINPANAMSDPVNLAAGEINNTVDAGLVPDATGGDTCIGDYVWNDMDYDGIQDSNEMGVMNANVYLGVDNNGDNLIDRYVDDTSTDANGNYLFCGLDPTNTYIVEFSPPMGCLTYTLPNVGNDDTVDSDPDISKGLVLNVVVVEGTTDDTIDAGLICNGD